MISNYFKTAIRNFYRNKAITLIKTLGLASGLAVTFFILIYITTETSYNDYNKKKERIFRVNQIDLIHGWKSINTPFPMRDALIEDFPIIEDATRLYSLNNVNVEIGNTVLKENTVICVDQSFFKIFTLNKIAGDFSGFDFDIHNVVITESTALKYFGKTDVLNKSFKMINGNEEYLLNITAIIEDIPVTSTIKADFITTTEIGLKQVNKNMIWSDGEERGTEFYRNKWSQHFVETYVLFEEKKNALDFDLKLIQLEAKYVNDTTQRDYFVQNLEDIYLHSEGMFGGDHLGDLNSIYIFSAIAFLVLLIACINYIILSISQIITRSKEIGIRKIAGALRADLLKQISVESIILIAITLPLAFILIEQFRPSLEQILKKQIILTYNLKFILGFTSIICFVILIPGINIVYFLNRISPVSILKKENNNHSRKFSFRKMLIIMQFVIFIVLVVLAIGIKMQINFSTRSELGFNPNNKVVISVNKIVQNGKYNTLKAELMKDPNVKSISGAMWLPPSNSRMSFSQTDSAYGDEPIKLEALFVDQDFIENFEIELLEGKSFKDYETSADWKILANETTANMLGKDKIIGRNIWNGEVIGIVKDFKFHSVHEKVQPMILVVSENMIREMVINYRAPVSKNIFDRLNNKLQDFQPDINFNPQLLNDRFDSLYEKENRLGTLVGIFSFIAIFIAAIGLLGITMFTTKNQTKNIAIRKVNGASILTIWKLLISDYIRLIIIALIIAIPISYYLLDKWLQSFAYQSDIDWWIFVAAGGLALIISLLTVSWYILNAARKNPVESLRYE